MFAAWTADPDHHGHAERTAVPPRPMAQGVRAALAAGAPLPRELRDRAAQRLGCPVRQGYGLTEATFSTIDDGRTGPTDESLVALGAPPAPLHVGAPVWGVELRIRDEAAANPGAYNFMVRINASGNIVETNPDNNFVFAL